ncbi:hypothetical protein N0V90_005938 [Kalmusia sp. IMI 367209]|nr:hypothetical protein N0V90_005938 [Kalmusia sp. IMI 367209]
MAHETSVPNPSETKRRKVRKGTRSCWECKRRKMKCIFESPSSIICSSCSRRGSACLSQEYDNSPITNPAEHGEHLDQGIPTPASTVSEYIAGQYRSLENDAAQGKFENLSRTLHSSLPSRQDMETICKARRHSCILVHDALILPYSYLAQNGFKTAHRLLDVPEPNAHPVLIARHMLRLAIFLQQVLPNLKEDAETLSESPSIIIERLAGLSIRLVTTNDELLGSIEALECVMIEGMYQANIGNLRRSWVAGRRAMGIAQLMGLDRPHNRAQYKVLDPMTENHPGLMWLRIVFLDRFLCLMLGLPQGCVDRSMASGPLFESDTSMGRLERIHCVIASRILERNESGPSAGDLALTQTLDMELQIAARSLPSQWWLSPKLDVTTSDSEALFWDTHRLTVQVLHYNLLNQLHLPHMLRSSSADKAYEYSRITCVNASREVLSRFITLRGINQNAYSCRTIDFLALMAAMTLLLAHLDSHRSEPNLLAHQYLSDRAMIEKTEENMRGINRFSSDALSAQSAELLRRLLSIEINLANGRHGGEKVSVQEAGSGTMLQEKENDGSVSMHIPYFGIIKIAREDHPSLIHHGLSDPTLQLDTYPEMTAAGEDWAFQGVDLAFFDSLMRSTDTMP